MIAFEAGAFIFQVRAAAVIEHEGGVLLHRAPHDDFWSCPGGRVEVGESAAATVARELKEELDAGATVGDLMFLVENFFDYEQRQYHEIGLYFTTRLESAAPILHATGEYYGREGDQDLIFRWFDRASLAQATVRPSFLPAALADEQGARFRHVIHADGNAQRPEVKERA